jgi:hypothetical protein
MADLQITQLPSASIATGSNVLPIVQGGVTDQITVTNLGQGIFNLGLPLTASGLVLNGNTQFNYGVFCSTASQTNPVGNVSRSMNLETTELSNGVSIASNSRITVANAGTYNLQFSAQLEKTDSGVDVVYIWFKKNGSNVARSNTSLDVRKAGGSGRLVAAWNYVDDYNAGDYVEIVWQSADTNMQLAFDPAAGNFPSIPSVIATLTQVS